MTSLMFVTQREERVVKGGGRVNRCSGERMDSFSFGGME